MKGIIFDLDGTLVDSVGFYFDALVDALRKFGYDISEKEFRKKYVGANPADIFKHFASENHIPDDKEEELESAFDKKPDKIDDIQLFPGVREMLERLHGRLKLCLASSSDSAYVDRVIDHLNIRKYFDLIITGDMVAETKPNPAIFNLAVERMGLEKNQVVILEDSLNGFLAAKDAGIKCYGVRHTVDALPEWVEEKKFENII